MKTLTELLHLPPLFKGFKFVSDTYDQGRPGYPKEANDWLRKDMEIKPGTVVLDLGAGTGKFTERLLDIGAQVIAVDPEESMREKFHAHWPDVKVMEGRAEGIPLPSQSVGAVICAQSFHLFASKESVREIHRVLKINGHFGMIWNVRDAGVEWVQGLADIVNRYAGDHPRYFSGEWRKVLEENFGGKFAPLKETHWRHGHTGSPEDVIVKRIKSISFIAAMPKEGRDKVMEEVRALIASNPALKDQQTITVPYDTVAVHTVKILP